MGTFGTTVNPAHYVEVPDPNQPGQVKRPPAGAVLKAQDAVVGTALADIVTVTYGYWAASEPGVDAILVSGDGGSTWVGPLLSIESEQAAAAGAGGNSSTLVALAQSASDNAANAASAAQQSAVDSGTAADSAAASAAVVGAAPGLVALYQNGDGSWPGRRSVTTDRTKLIAVVMVVAGSSYPPTSPVVTSGAGLDLPTVLDLFCAANFT